MNWLFKLIYPDKFMELERERIIYEREKSICESCISLKLHIGQLTAEKDKLLDRILNPVQEVKQTELPPQITRPVREPWNLTRRRIEAQDRALAEKLKAESEALKGAANVKQNQVKESEPKQNKVVESKSVEELEKELDIA